VTEQAVDVYGRYQGVIDWHQVRAAGVTSMWCKLTNGLAVPRVTPSSDTYISGARAAGVKVGGYAYVLDGDPGDQAMAFARELKRLDAVDIAPMLDFEDASLPTSQSERHVWIGAFFETLAVEISGLTKVLLYSSASELQAIGPITVPGLQVLMHDAEYGANNGAEHARTHYTKPVAVHQYTSNGHVSGINGVVDRNTIYTDITNPVEAPVTDPLNEEVARTNPMYDGSVLTGQTSLKGIVERFDNKAEQDAGHFKQILAALADLKSTVAELQAGQTPASALSGAAVITVQLSPTSVVAPTEGDQS
jgi:GH25 family lysozyme M1 (1,4-beta-N-acetylmuramidase)